MRYIMKGGVWKNSQDEILKAAIMKYGLNQWSRISSLLQRKSAKQCKQRWYQWLDPSIKKTQWSRAQDQKLLQLARVFPSQWRTIAPFVGRTPTQCFQRYEKLLDLAQGKTGQQTQDLKRLRPRQIDPNPQTKPARPDPIDMDQDQKQMLAEVRVRLANTKGKKAKRKQREKIIQQARRLAQLQKIRELEMAGVDNIPTAKQIKRMRQKQDIDYNKQIPFKRQIPEFIYKVQSSQTSKNAFFASTISLQTLEGKRRDVQEQLQRKLDKKRIKRLKDTDYKAMMALKNRFEKPVSVPIKLPEPELNEKDLQDMKKYNITTPLNSLVQNTPYGMTPQNKIILSARINFSLNHRDMMTPVGEQQHDNDLDGVEGLNYLKNLQKQSRDPNKLRSVDRLISQRIKTPSAHQFQQDQNRVRNLFKNLRKPENIIEFQIPQQEQQEVQEEQQQIIDAEQQQQIQLQKQKQLLQQKLNTRNQVLKLNLQRIKNIPQKINPSSKNQIDKLIQQQMINMIYSDAIDYPIQMFNLPQQHNLQYVAPFSVNQRKIAQQLIDTQVNQSEKYQQSTYEKYYQKANKYLNLDYKNKKVLKASKQISAQVIEKHHYCYDFAALPFYKQLDKSNEQLEKKTKKFMAGYQKIITNKVEQINKLEQQLDGLKTLRNTLQVLAQQQSFSASKRLQNEENFYKIIYNSI